MLDTSSMWWKYVDVDRFKELLSDVPDRVKYITTSGLGDVCLLDDKLNLIGAISLSNEEVEVYDE